MHEIRIELFIDMFTFQGFQFLLIESSRIKYIDIFDVHSSKIEGLVPFIKVAILKYTTRGLKVAGLHVENKFYHILVADSVTRTKHLSGKGTC